jgi:hypothetical protein
MRRRTLGLWVLIGCSLSTAIADAQSVTGGLTALLTEQTPPPVGFVRDIPAAQATLQTVAGLFQVELTSIPVVSSSGGFVYRFSPSFGTVERASDSFGPFFSERTLRNGARHLSVGLGYQVGNFETLQGADLTSGAFPTNAARFVGRLDPFSVDTLSLEMEVQTVSVLASYGLTDRLDIGMVAPFTTVRFSGRRVNTYLGQTALQSQQSASSTGIGDLALNLRYTLRGGSQTGVAVGTDLRLPTGREEDLLGAGKAAWRVLGIGSWERGVFAAHGNAGFSVGGASRELFWSGALTWAASQKLSVVGEVIGRRLTQLNRLADVYQPHPVLAGIETMRWIPTGGGVHTTFLVTGVKWNVVGNWLLNSNLLFRLTDAGLSARVSPSVGLEYALGF